MTQADVTVNRTSGLVTAKLSVRGKVGVSLAVYPDNFVPQTATQFTVTRGHDQHYTWDTTATGGNYAFSVYGPDGFLSSFAGAVVPASQTRPRRCRRSPRGSADGHKRMLILTLENDGHEPVPSASRPTTTPASRRASRGGGHKQTVHWPANADGYYDVTVTADSGDGFLRRYAGRIA